MRRYPYPFYGQYADMKATIANEVAGCETSDDLARLKRWIASFCQDILFDRRGKLRLVGQHLDVLAERRAASRAGRRG